MHMRGSFLTNLNKELINFYLSLPQESNTIPPAINKMKLYITSPTITVKMLLLRNNGNLFLMFLKLVVKNVIDNNINTNDIFSKKLIILKSTKLTKIPASIKKYPQKAIVIFKG